MYAFHRKSGDGMYTSWMIYSPGVPVFRDDDGALLDEPYTCAFVTAPAVNAGVVLKREPARVAEIAREMRARVDRVLAICAAHAHTDLVLGAWGCGVFRNDPDVVAECFRASFEGPFVGAFERVVFAVLDGAEKKNLAPFERRFA